MSVIPKDEEDCRVLAVSVYQALVNEIKKLKESWRTISIEPQIVSLGRLAKKDSAVIDFGTEEQDSWCFVMASLSI